MIISGMYQDQRHEILLWLGIADGMMHVGLSYDIAGLVNRGLVNFSDERFGNELLLELLFNHPAVELG